MAYLTKNIKGLGLGLLAFLLVIWMSVNQVILQKVQGRLEMIIPIMLMNIKNACNTTGNIQIDETVFTCIPREAV